MRSTRNRSSWPVLRVRPTAPARAPNNAPERRPSPSGQQRRTARREFEDEEAAVAAHNAFAAEDFTFLLGYK
jgi:hypothetical protein